MGSVGNAIAKVAPSVRAANDVNARCQVGAVGSQLQRVGTDIEIERGEALRIDYRDFADRVQEYRR